MVPGRQSSRELWEKAQAPGLDGSLALARAVMYELQPVRFSVLMESTLSLTEAYSRASSSVIHLVHETFVLIQTWGGRLIIVGTHFTWKDVVFIGCIVGYCALVRYLHRVLDAGPFVVIASAVILILTVGLGDESSSDSQGGQMSAYSVFNRHCRSILGSIDVERLVAQYAGGGLDFGNNMQFGRGGEHDDLDDHDGDVRGDNTNRQAFFGGRQKRKGGSRKCGKKARRQNLEQKRERQRQRQVAASMGFTGDGRAGEAEAMNRLMDNVFLARREEEEDFVLELDGAGFDA